MTPYCTKEDEGVMLFFNFLIVASLFIVWSCKEIETQRTDGAIFFKIFKELTSFGMLKMSKR